LSTFRQSITSGQLNTHLPVVKGIKNYNKKSLQVNGNTLLGQIIILVGIIEFLCVILNINALWVTDTASLGEAMIAWKTLFF